MTHDAAEFERYIFPGGYSPARTRCGCRYDPINAQIAVDFFSKRLVHIKGELAGKPLTLEKWQAAIVATLFGWKRKDGTRRYRMAYIEVPRKNGKSTLSAGIALLFLYLDSEPGAEIYSAAADADQAAIVFELAKENVLRSKLLASRSKVYRRSIVSYDRNAVIKAAYKVLSSDAHTKHGYNPNVIIADELHAHKTRDLWDVLNTGTGARREPMTIAITTAGYDKETVCWEQHQYAEKVRDGVFEDESFLPVIYAAAATDDWQSPEVWQRCNPNYGVSVKPDKIALECQKANETPGYENTFKRLYLNLWTEQATRWLQMKKWDACGAVPVVPEDLYGRTCYAGLDLSSERDITAFVLMFPNEDESFTVLPYFWLPGETATIRERQDRVPYSAWIREGLITKTEGNSIDMSLVRKTINDLREQYNITQIAFDRWGAADISQKLGEQDGFDVVKFGQGVGSLSAPSKRFETLVNTGTLHHGGNKVLTWMASNVAVKPDDQENIKPVKKHSNGRIDGIVAAIMALGIAMAGQESYYEHNRLLVL